MQTNNSAQGITFADGKGSVSGGKKIILSADDFGISRIANENILSLIRLGKLDRVEVMMSKNITSVHAAELLASKVKLDIHLHLVKNKLDFWQEHARNIEGGAMLRGIKFLAKYILGTTSAKNIEKEWQCQIEDFVKVFGRVPDGASSHEHIHFFPPYFNRLTRLCKKFQITYIRFGRKKTVDYSTISKIINWLRERDIKKFNGMKLDSADFMISFDWINDPALIANQYGADATKEVVFHPEKTDEFDVLMKFNEIS